MRFPQCLRRTRGWGWSRGDTSMSSTTRGRSTGGIHVNTITVAMDTASSSARHSSLSSSLAAAASSASGSTLGCSQVGQDVCMCVCVCDLIIDEGGLVQIYCPCQLCRRPGSNGGRANGRWRRGSSCWGGSCIGTSGCFQM